MTGRNRAVSMISDSFCCVPSASEEIAVLLAQPEPRLADFPDLGFDLGGVLARLEAEDRALAGVDGRGQGPVEVEEVGVRLALALVRLAVAGMEADRARVEHPVVDGLRKKWLRLRTMTPSAAAEHVADDLVVVLRRRAAGPISR